VYNERVNFSIGYLILVLAITLASMILHELMHGLTAYWLGDDTAKRAGRLTLNPIKHIDPVMTLVLPLFLAVMGGPIFGGAKPVPFDPRRVKGGEWGAALVGVVGPITNFVLALICFALIALFKPSGILDEILSLGVMINLGFAVFNIIPIPPLDGSRVLYALAPDAARRAMEAIERYGLILIFILVMIFNQPLGQLMSGAMNGILRFFNWIFGGGII
jgi:Zn-dependent protease